jgi:hypothetical protein
MSTERTLANVEDLFLELFQLVVNMEDPKGLEPSIKLACWGIDPALRRDRSAEVELPRAEFTVPASLPIKDDDLNGLVDGVGLEVLGEKDWLPPRPGGAAGENLEGTVPARARRAGLCVVLSDGGGMKSGKPS